MDKKTEQLGFDLVSKLYFSGIVKITETLLMCFSSFGSVWLLNWTLEFDNETIALAALISIPAMSLYSKLFGSLFKVEIQKISDYKHILVFRIVSIFAAVCAGILTIVYLFLVMNISENLTNIFLISLVISLLSSNVHMGLISSTKNISSSVSSCRIIIFGSILSTTFLDIDVTEQIYFVIFMIIFAFIVLDMRVKKRL